MAVGANHPDCQMHAMGLINEPSEGERSNVFAQTRVLDTGYRPPCYTQFRCTPYDEGLVGRQSLYLYLQYSSGSHTLLY